MQFRLIFLPFLLLLSSSVSAANADLSNLASLFSQQDAILLKAPDGQTKFEKNPNQLMVPASTVKLVTALLCLEQYGADHQWPTNFVIGENKLLVRGAGDPFLVSEEIDLIAAKLVPEIKSPIEQLIVETTWLKEETLRFRTQVDDPYNAPASAVAANFNSVKLQRLNGSWISAEPQTPLTALAESLADNFHRLKPWVSGETRRVNLQTSDNAHRYFAEVLLAKIKDINPDLVSQTPTIRISQDNAAVDPLATSITYTNSRTLGQIIKAGLQFSNNFIFNQLFLSLNEATSKSFADAQVIAKTRLASSFNWRDFSLVEG
ncbi:MAG: D-alanyl-D-alanine carboxypeptidase, partial [Pseudomonadota bacterium]